MTAPLFRVPAGELANQAVGSLVRLDGPEGHHATRVRRLRPGQQLLVADGSGRLAQAQVVSVTPGALTARVVGWAQPTEVEFGTDPAPAIVGPRFVLVQALVKNGRDEQAIAAATELGVDEIVPWQADRCVVVWRGERAERSRRRWAAAADAAAKQSRRAVVPPVGEPVDTGGLCRLAAAAELTLVLHEEAAQPLAGMELPDQGTVLIAVGPEGGIGPAELAQLQAAGAHLVRLGSTVLRSATAGPAALAVLSARSRWR